MKQKLSHFLILFILSCNPTNKPKQAVTKFSQIATFYKDTSFNSLYVFPDTVVVGSTYAFRGIVIDSIAYGLLPNFITLGYTYSEGVYGIYRFPIDEGHIGIITRTLSDYSPSVISLSVYDLQRDSITNNVQLADIFSDAGDYQTINSYLFFDDKKQLKVLTYRHDLYYHEVNDLKDTTVDQYHYYALQQIHYNRVDTLSVDSLQLHKEFGKQLRRMEVY